MNKLKLLNDIKDCYDNGGNIIQYLKDIEKRDTNTIEDILISYDFQAGSYNSEYKRNPDYFIKYHNEIANTINKYIKLINKKCVIMEAGLGEATTLGPILSNLSIALIDKIYGFDISWSRIKYAEKFLSELGYLDYTNLFVGDLMNMPIKDSGIDIVYTVHSVEPNGGKEREVLLELHRVTGKYLILFEPAYEFADAKSKERMKRNGYVTQLYKTAVDLGFNVIVHKLLGVSLNPSNPTGVMVIEKSGNSMDFNNKQNEEILCCPISKGNLVRHENIMYSESSMLMFPVMANIPCLLKDNAIVASKFREFVCK